MNAFAQTYDDVGRVRAEIDFIANLELREAAERMQDALWEATGGEATDEDVEAYWDARKDFIEEARIALQHPE